MFTYLYFSSINAIEDIQYKAEIHKFSPDRGSVFGGTILTIKGAGFDTDNTDVTLKTANDEYNCTTLQITPTMINCQVVVPMRTVNITHAGTDIGRSYTPDSHNIEKI